MADSTSQRQFRDDKSIVTVTLISGTERKSIDIPTRLTIEQIIGWAINKFRLPPENLSELSPRYDMTLRRTRRILSRHSTIESNGIRSGDELELTYGRENMLEEPPPPAETSIERTASPKLIRTKQENPWPEIVDDNLREAISVIRENQEGKRETERELIGIDKTLLRVFAIALLGALFFTFYLIAVDRLDPVSNVLYPIISLILGFMSGYFAGTGRSKGR